jgi:hypothetical protein
VEECRPHEAVHLQHKKGKIGSTNPLGRLKTKSTNSQVASPSRRMASAHILPPNAGANPSAERRCIPFKQAAHHVEHPLSLGTLGMNLQGHDKLRRRKAETLKAKGRRELGGKRAQRVGEKRRHSCYSRDEPLFKGRLPRSRPKTPWEVSPDAHRSTQPMTRRPGPASHTTCALVCECEGGKPPRKVHATDPR